MPKKDITINLDDDQIAELQLAFPELDGKECAKQIATFATNEMINLLAGRKRYLSLSHQYIEWLEELNEKLVPDIEFTPRRLMNQFRFPPGTASYISRVLRDRQNVALMQGAWKSLAQKFQEIKKTNDNAPRDQKAGPGQLLSITLTKREFRQLEMLLDEFEASELKKLPAQRQGGINLPEIGENRMDFIKIKYPINVIERIIVLLQTKE